MRQKYQVGQFVKVMVGKQEECLQILSVYSRPPESEAIQYKIEKKGIVAQPDILGVC